MSTISRSIDVVKIEGVHGRKFLSVEEISALEEAITANNLNMPGVTRLLLVVRSYNANSPLSVIQIRKFAFFLLKKLFKNPLTFPHSMLSYRCSR